MIEGEIQPGDTVFVKPHKTAPSLYPDRIYEHEASGQEHVVESICNPRRWPYFSNATLGYLTPDGADHRHHYVDIRQLVLVKKGPGRFIPGESLPFSEHELRQQRWHAYLGKLGAANAAELTTGHQGFSNAATFLAAVYLDQEQRAHEFILGRRRKDGTINVRWVVEAFRDHKLEIDSWATEPLVDVPAEFARHFIPKSLRREVDWQEVAKFFEDKR